MTDNRTTELLCCPFCGGEAHISDDYSSERGLVYSIWHDCPAGGDYHPYGHGAGVLQISSAWFSSRDDAIEAWNTRTGCGECENVAPSYLDFLCSSCGFVHYHSDENDSGDGNEWNFCPSCGKAVKR